MSLNSINPKTVAVLELAVRCADQGTKSLGIYVWGTVHPSMHGITHPKAASTALGNYLWLHDKRNFLGLGRFAQQNFRNF
jgi:hypothetical protein